MWAKLDDKFEMDPQLVLVLDEKPDLPFRSNEVDVDCKSGVGIAGHVGHRDTEHCQLDAGGESACFEVAGDLV
jgi:hypothetical protein